MFTRRLSSRQYNYPLREIELLNLRFVLPRSIRRNMKEYDESNNFIPCDEVKSDVRSKEKADGCEKLPTADKTNDGDEQENAAVVTDYVAEENAQTTDNGQDAHCSEQQEQEEQRRANRRKVADKVINWVLVCAILVLILLNVLKIFVISDVTIQQNSMQPTYHPDDKVTISKLTKPQTSDVVVVYKNDVNKLQAYFAPSSEKQSNGKYELLIKRAVAIGGDTVWVTIVPTTAGDRYALAVQKNGNTYYEFYVWDADQGIDNFAVANNCERGKYVLCDSLEHAKEQYGPYVVQITMSSVGILGNYSESSPYTLAADQMLLLGDNRDRSNDSRSMGFFPSTRLLGVVTDK